MKDKMKDKSLGGALFFLVFLAVGAGALLYMKNYSDETFEKLYKRDAVLKQARKHVSNGEMELALETYKKALQREYVQDDDDKHRAISGMIKVYTEQGIYDEAKKLLAQWYIDKGKNNPSVMLWQSELNALKRYSETNNSEPVHKHIDKIYQMHGVYLPPNNWGVASDIYISKIIRLYDTVGDYDAGINFVDETLKVLKRNTEEHGGDASLYDKIKTVRDADAHIKLLSTKGDNRNRKICENLREYLLVREAFEKDKAEGTKGRATKALIQSDYFPW